MKIRDLFEDAALLNANDQLDELEEAYTELALLKLAFDKKDLGILIRKPNRVLRLSDIREIKRKLSDIIMNNPIIDDQEISRGRDGDEKMRLFWNKLGHGLEATALSILSGALAATAVASAGVPVGSVLSGAGAVGTGVLAKKQFDVIGSLNATSKLIDIVDAYGDLKPTYRPSRFKRFVDFLLRRTPDEIEKDTKKRIRQASMKAQNKIQKSLKGFPKYIEYEDNDGSIKEYPVANFFNI